MDKETSIFVYADYLNFNNELVGTLYVSQQKGKEFYSFEYSDSWLKKGSILLDPDLKMFKGRQYITNDKVIFGMLADSCPDRWGRRLMLRREEMRARGADERPRKLLESDYLLGVFDESRMGGLRFKTNELGPFLSNDQEYATPPWTSLRELEYASSEFEKNDNALAEKWLKQLLAPGSSLGGARPKASVLAPDGSLWIAKFPSRHDDINVGAWEMVVHELAKMCGLNVPDAQTEHFSKLGTTFLVKRFDRDNGKRIHFSSAMTLLGKKDGADSSSGNSYLDIVSFIKANGANPTSDTIELWKRIVFSIAVSNTDDHFRNHGFILTKKGWELSPLYDVNPDIYGEYLSLNIDENQSDLSFDLAISAAKYYGIKETQAKDMIDEIKNIVSSNWQVLAKKQGISRSEIERMKYAFRF